MEDIRKSILEMANGAFKERADYKMGRLIDNLLDPNTKATEPRKLTITLTFKADDSRKNIGVSCTAKPSLATTNPVTTSLFIAKSTSTGEVEIGEMTPNIPGQINMDGSEQESAPILKLIHTA